jgi:DNA invertase Pin-like site-specific DNA recombinase
MVVTLQLGIMEDNNSNEDLKRTVLYVRCSTIQQSTDRQLVNSEDYEFILEDKCSGTIPIFERKNGKLLKVLIDESSIDEIQIHTIDRLARNLKSLLGFIDYIHERGISLYIKNLGMRTLVDGKMNYVMKMLISILGSFGEVENEIRRERQLEGIAIAKIKGRYKNRTPRGKETPSDFLKKHSKAVEYLKMGMMGSEVIRLMDGNLNKNTITKIKKYMNKDKRNLSIEIMEKKKGEEFVEGLKKEPFVSITEYVELKTGYGVK